MTHQPGTSRPSLRWLSGLGFRERLRIEVARRHLTALGRELADELASHSRPSTRDDRKTTFEAFHGHSSAEKWEGDRTERGAAQRVRDRCVRPDQRVAAARRPGRGDSS